MTTGRSQFRSSQSGSSFTRAFFVLTFDDTTFLRRHFQCDTLEHTLPFTGSFGKVRLAINKLTSYRCAIKQIPRSAAPPLLTREIHHHRRFHHPNVVRLFEVIATEGSIWLVSELCSGGELFDYLVEKGRLGEMEARRMFGQLCLAVGYIHSLGVVHRDLKLENVLLDERCNVKLADFGFGREFEQRRLMETFCGTTGYAAPEMLAGRKYTGQGAHAG